MYGSPPVAAALRAARFMAAEREYRMVVPGRARPGPEFLAALRASLHSCRRAVDCGAAPPAEWPGDTFCTVQLPAGGGLVGCRAVRRVTQEHWACVI